MNQYKELREKQQKEFNAFPMFFAFSASQFEEGMKKLGLNPEDTDKIYGTGSGGYYRKADSEELSNLLNKLENELDEAIKADTDALEKVFYDLSSKLYQQAQAQGADMGGAAEDDGTINADFTDKTE